MSRYRWQLLASLLIPLAHAEETTTDNLIDIYGWTEEGTILNHQNHHHTDWQGGLVHQTIDLSPYEGQTSYNYTTDVYACGNQIGGHCGSGRLDTFTVTLTLDTGEQWVNTFSVGNQWEEVDITYTPTEDATTAHLELYGIDNGYWAGWYGPVFYSGSFTVTFDPTLTEVIMPAANPELTTVLPADPMSDPSMGMTSPDLGTPTVEISAPAPEVTTVAPQQSTPPETRTSETSGTTGTSGTTASNNADNSSSDNSDSGSSSNKSSGRVSVRTAAGVVSANIDTATASAKSIGEAFGDPSDPVAQAVMVAVMASQGAELNDAKLIEPKLPKPRRIADKRLQDRFWLDSLKSEVRFQKHMVDKQWQK